MCHVQDTSKYFFFLNLRFENEAFWAKQHKLKCPKSPSAFENAYAKVLWWWNPDVENSIWEEPFLSASPMLPWLSSLCLYVFLLPGSLAFCPSSNNHYATLKHYLKTSAFIWTQRKRDEHCPCISETSNISGGIWLFSWCRTGDRSPFLASHPPSPLRRPRPQSTAQLPTTRSWVTLGLERCEMQKGFQFFSSLLPMNTENFIWRKVQRCFFPPPLTRVCPVQSMRRG